MKQEDQSIVLRKCKFCDYMCRNQPQLWNHEWTHKNPQGIECGICHKNFKAPNLLQNHRNNVHKKSQRLDGNKDNLTCPECEHVFYNKQQLLRHKVRHTKEKPYQCELCDQLFGWKRSLNFHIKQFHGPRVLDQHPLMDIDFLCDENLLIF